VTNYSRGASFERRVVKWYQEQGFASCRSAGSHGKSDVWAYHKGQMIFNSLRIHNIWSPLEREEFEDYCKTHGAIGRYVWRDKGNKICFKEL